MKKISLLITLILVQNVFAGSNPPEQNTQPNKVHVREDCGTQQDCFETLISAGSWVFTQGNPSAANPVLIDIGPGHFDRFYCNGGSNVTLKGVGRENTYIGKIFVNNCDNLAFQDLTAIASTGTTVSWNGAGKATWTDVDIIAKAVGDNVTRNVAWIDGPSIGGQCNEPSLHYFFGSRIWAIGAVPDTYAFAGNCSDVWFYGGEILTDLSQTESTGISHSITEAFNVTTAHRFQAFGTALRLKSSALLQNPNGTYPIDEDPNKIVNVWVHGYQESQAFDGTIGTADDSPQFHIHGGIISSSSSVLHRHLPVSM